MSLALAIVMLITKVYGGESVLVPVVISGTRVAQSSFDLPLSVDRIDQRQIQLGQPQVNLSETLLSVPGVSAQSRQNYAQDLQISIRGFGARSGFGVRGVRLYADGIPGTMPDGQGQFSHFDLGSTDHIEVLRGPFSALYGNSSGGVIAIFTEDGKPGNTVDGTAELGSFATRRYSLKDAGDTGVVNYLIDAAHFETEGYRNHGAAERNNANAKLRFALSETSKLTVIANAVETPFVQDPLGLTQTQLALDPTQAGTNAIAYSTRKRLSQEQLGATYEQALNASDTLVASVYAGQRSTTQYQAILAKAETLASHPGGVIDLSRHYRGLDVHVIDARTVGAGSLTTTAGLSADDLREARRGFLNFSGTTLGVEGALRRNEANHVYDFDQYLQVQWDPNSHWLMLAGVRHSLVDVESHNVLPATLSASSAARDSGTRYSAVNPVAGITFRARRNLNLYIAYGKGFETPTLNDLAYRSADGSLPGLNVGLKPARSDNGEIGLKLGSEYARVNIAAFNVNTHDELAVLSSSGGRSVYQNIGDTRRRGLEFALDSAWGGDGRHGAISTRLAYSYIHAVTAQSYKTCIGLPCGPGAINTGTVGAGRYLPAIPMNSLYAGATWAYTPVGLSATLELQSRAQIYADDRNSAAASGYWVANIRAGFEQTARHWRISEFIRLDNIADRAYVGSVIVNESNSRFFEPAPGRTAYVMFNAARLN